MARKQNRTEVQALPPPDAPHGYVVKQLLAAMDITQAEAARRLTKPDGKPYSKSLLYQLINGQASRFWPRRDPEFGGKVRDLAMSLPGAEQWLAERGYTEENLWTPLPRREQATTPRQGRWTNDLMSGLAKGNPEEHNLTEEVEMISQAARKRFGLFRSPFHEDIRGDGDIYLSDEHRYIAAAMEDAARHGGFIAVIGEVGSGKSVMRKKVVSALGADDRVRIVYPRMIDKTRVSQSSLCDAIVMDLSDERPKSRLEQKARQVERLLISRAEAGVQVALIIEEAHDLPVRVLKLLKRFHEIEHGYRRCLGITLIGQPELGHLFQEGDHYEMREVIRRCQVAWIQGLNGDMRPYLDHKFKRINKQLQDVMDEDALVALSARLMARDSRGREVSRAYPLTVQNLLVRAMNEAAELGYDRVNREVIEGLR